MCLCVQAAAGHPLPRPPPELPPLVLRPREGDPWIVPPGAGGFDAAASRAMAMPTVSIGNWELDVSCVLGCEALDARGEET